MKKDRGIFSLLTVICALVMLAGILLPAFGAEPTARITQGTLTVAIGVTNKVQGEVLNTGIQSGGASVLKSLIYTIRGDGVTNGTITFMAYDGAYAWTIYTKTGLVTGASERWEVTNTVYTGTIRVRAQQDVSAAANYWDYTVISQ